MALCSQAIIRYDEFNGKQENEHTSAQTDIYIKFEISSYCLYDKYIIVVILQRRLLEPVLGEKVSRCCCRHAPAAVQRSRDATRHLQEDSLSLFVVQVVSYFVNSFRFLLFPFFFWQVRGVAVVKETATPVKLL